MKLFELYTDQESSPALHAYMKAIRKYEKTNTHSPELEPIIAREPRIAYLYARNILKGRFRLAEPTIASDRFYRRVYKEVFGVKLKKPT